MTGNKLQRVHRWLPIAGLGLALLLLGLSACLPDSWAQPGWAAATVTVAAAVVFPGQFIFDDFAYTDKEVMRHNGWILRDAPGWPGVAGATWSPDHLELVDDAEQPGNRLIRLNAATDGTPANTRQAQFCHARKYFEGTYATRVRFTDRPISGPGGDQVVQTFYQIAPQQGDLDPLYSELDFEYLPAGGWGKSGSTLFFTSWETFLLDPWQAYNQSDQLEKSLDGWHTLVMQVGNGEVRYFVDGQCIAIHGGKNYPRVPMAMSYNLWFIREGVGPAGELRTYSQWVDWVYYEAKTLLSPAEVEARVGELREAGVTFNDSVPENDPPLESPCNF